MDLPRHPLPLVVDAGLPGLGHQLGVETGVLLESSLQLDQRPAALLAEIRDPLPSQDPEADRNRLDDHDEAICPPVVGRRVGVDDHRIDHQRAERDPGEGDRCRSEQECVDEAGDHEDEEDAVVGHE